MVQSGEMPLEEFVAKQSAWMSKLMERCAGLRMTISGPPLAAGRNGKPWKKKRSATQRRGSGARTRKPRAAD